MAGSDEEEQAAGTYAQTGAGAPGAAAGAAAGGVSSGVGQPMDVGAGFLRDKDPPPSYDGSNPEVSFRQYEKSVRLWQWETDIPLKKQAAKLLRALSGNARLAVEEMEFDEIATEDGVKNLMGRLRDFFTPHLEVALPRAFEAAVYGQSRQARETFAEYVSRMERSFIQLAKEGVDLPSGAKGYIVYRQASLSKNQEQRVQTWCEGSYEQKEVLKALRKPGKVLKEKPGKGHYLNQINEDSEYVFHQETVEGTGLDEDEDDQYIWIAEGDLDEIMPEEQVQEALASYKEVRNALRDQRNNRGFYPKGKGKFGNSFGGKGKGKRRVHQEELKMRTRCHNCGQVGHWKDECSNPSRKAGSSGGSTSSTSSSARTGFLVMGGNPKMESTEFWLKEFVKGRTAKESCGSGASDSTEEEQYRSGGMCDRDGTQFFGIAIRAEEGIVDTAAEAGLVGLFAYERLEKELQKFGLKPKWTEKQATAKGVGGEANAVGVVLIPLGIGKIDGILEATVVREDVPLLLPVSLIKMLKACLDFDKFTFTIPDHEIVLPMHEMKSGHVTIGITEFSEGPFHVPPQAGHIDEFTHVHPSAMLVQCEQRDQKFERPRVDLHSFLQHGGLAQPCEDAGATTCDYGSGRCNHGFAGGQTEEGHSKLESGARQNCHYPCHGGLARSYRRMVAGFITFGIFYRGDWQHSGGLLCGDHQDWKTTTSAEVEEGFSNYGSIRLRAPKEHVGDGWQCSDVLRSLQSVPRKMGESISSKGCEGRVQEGGSLNQKQIQEDQAMMEQRSSHASSGVGATPKAKVQMTSAVEEIRRENLRNRETMDVMLHTQLMVDQLAKEQQASSSQNAFQMEEMHQMGQEMRQMMQHMREKATQQEALVHMMANQVQRSQMPRSPSPGVGSASGTYSDAVPASHVSQRSKTVKCLCGAPAEKLTVKKEGPRQGRHFWKCMQRRCQFFEWVPMEEEIKTPPPRRKSPRRGLGSAPTSNSWTHVVEIEDSDGQL